MFVRFALAFALATLACASADAQMRGHGGPVRAVAVSPDGTTAISGSFDTSAIRWSLSRNAAEQVLRFHESAVNAVAFLKDGRIVTGGEDGAIALWKPGQPMPERIFKGHTAPIVALAVSPDGRTVASASWDRTVRLWPVESGAPRVLEGHTQNVNGVAFAPDGKTLISAGYDATLRIWPLDGNGAPIVVTLPTALNAVAVAPDGEIIASGANGRVYFLSSSGQQVGEAEVGETPVISLAASPDGTLVAAAGIRGSVALIDRKTRAVSRTLVGPGLPVWSVAFFPDSKTLLTGGADRMVRRWNAQTGEHIGAVPLTEASDPLAAYAGDRGAEVYRACIACHTLSADEGNRAGPTLAGIFGRKIATLPGYDFSEALKKLDIVWTPETVSKLFEIGPNAYTPGTKMPEQTIGSAEDRKALTDFLKKATAR
ncbi:c-type cytochrome [Pseudorhodoplanes sp.]|uniref:c-type cytochrome n=1 Tax=Pseudorhodoplanes sp. TaxID=1934341 RepID=UPI002CD2E5FB|nr:c-type cytochrome [Pseudorhodoplanes sp.]HWV41001.1 c-type cytochrome [Pseudorhodoplanes sp.]